MVLAQRTATLVSVIRVTAVTRNLVPQDVPPHIQNPPHPNLVSLKRSASQTECLTPTQDAHTVPGTA